MANEPGLPEALRGLVAILERTGCPYAVGGAIAMAFAGHLRGTRDVDVLVSIPAVRMQELADSLNAAGCRMRDAEGAAAPVDVRRMTEMTRELGQFRVWWRDSILIEVFSPKVPLQDAILKRRIRVVLEDFSLWITTAEDLILLKMIFHRPKDLEDVRRMIASGAGRLDVPYLRDWLPKTLEPAAREELSAWLPGGP